MGVNILKRSFTIDTTIPPEKREDLYRDMAAYELAKMLAPQLRKTSYKYRSDFGGVEPVWEYSLVVADKASNETLSEMTELQAVEVILESAKKDYAIPLDITQEKKEELLREIKQLVLGWMRFLPYRQLAR